MSELSDLLAVAQNNTAGVFYHSPETLAVLQFSYSWLKRWSIWESPAEPLTDEDRDAIDALISEAMRELMSPIVGMIVPFITATPPDNVLPCDGSQYQRADYPALYAALDSVFIVDADNFTVPDLRGLTVIGSSAGHSFGSTGGAETHTLTEGELPSHAHTYTPPTLNLDLESPGAPDIFAAGIGITTLTGFVGSNQAHNNMPPFMALRYGVIAG